LDLSIKYNGNLNSFNISPGAITKFISSLASELEQEQRGLQSLKEEYKRHENAVIQEVQDLKTKIGSAHETKKLTNTQMDTVRAKITKLNEQLRYNHSSQFELDRLQSSLKDENEELSRLKSEFEALDPETESQGLSNELRQYENKLNSLSYEMSVLNTQADSRAKLSIKKSEKERIDISLRNLYVMSKAYFRLNSVTIDTRKVLGFMPSIETLQSEITAVHTTKQQEYESVDQKLRDLNVQISAKKSSLDATQKELTVKESELQSKKSRITTVCGNETFEDALEEANAIVDECKEYLFRPSNKQECYYFEKCKLHV
jgi:DNA repair protein RAD50